MVGYPESLTDPSYKGQILVLTYPLIGNYGVFSDETDANGVPLYFESSKIHASALIVGTYSDDFSNWRAVKSLSKWLKDNGVPAIYGVDTRALTKKIRTKGVMLAKVVVSQKPVELFDPNKHHLVAEGKPSFIFIFIFIFIFLYFKIKHHLIIVHKQK
jgi:carbamoyl-phosphate synthase small subunit